MKLETTEFEVGDIVRIKPNTYESIFRSWNDVTCIITRKTPIQYVLKAYGENASDNSIVCMGDEFALVCKSNEKDSTVKFEVGDKVRIKPKTFIDLYVRWNGVDGVITKIFSTNQYIFTPNLDFDGYSLPICGYLVCRPDIFELISKKDSTMKPKFQPSTKVVFLTTIIDKPTSLRGDVIATSDNGGHVDIYVKKYMANGGGKLFSIPVENVRECSNREIGYMEMLASLITSIDQAGGQIPTERLLKMTVEELIFELGHNNVRFKFDKPVKP